jgi:hypothetical protein
MNLRGNEQEVYEYLKSIYLMGGDWISPTRIGVTLRGPNHHSAWASPICKRLVTKGLIERNEKGHYRIVRYEAHGSRT